MAKLKRNIAKKLSAGNDLSQYGSIVFGVGLALAIVAAIINVAMGVSQTVAQVTTAVLIIIGLIIGFLNITSDETLSFLIASIVLVVLIGPFLGNIMQTFSIGQTGSQLISELFKNLIGLVVPAAIIVALRTLFIVAKDEN